MKKTIQKVLAIETSCDDTSVAIVDLNRHVLCMRQASQDDVHAPFGGVVPEIASRNHSYHLLPLIERCLEQARLGWPDIDGVAVTNRPGLVGSLLVGIITAKTLAMTQNLPLIGINHLEGHIYAPFLQDEKYTSPEPEYPFLALAVSGGHSSLYRVEEFGKYHILGQTIDDAAGEAFDKFAKMMGLGYPGGVLVDRNSQGGDVARYNFPRALQKDESYNFSFSGLKTSAQRLLTEISEKEKQDHLSDLCASYQQAIVDALLNKLEKAIDSEKPSTVVITGGVSANSALRAQSEELAHKKGVQLLVPPLRFCTDNAAMIGLAGLMRFNQNEFSEQSMSPSPRPLPNDFLN